MVCRVCSSHTFCCLYLIKKIMSESEILKVYTYLSPIKKIINHPTVNLLVAASWLTHIEHFNRFEFHFDEETGRVDEYFVNSLLMDSPPDRDPILDTVHLGYEAKIFFKEKISEIVTQASFLVENELDYGSDRINASKFSVDVCKYVYVMIEMLGEKEFSDESLKEMTKDALESFLNQTRISMRLHGVDSSALKEVLIPKSNSKSEQTMPFTPLTWQGNVSQLFTLFADLMNRDKLATANGRAFINASPKEVENFIFQAFRDKEGNELSRLSIKTYLDPNHEKEVSGKKRIKPEMRD